MTMDIYGSTATNEVLGEPIKCSLVNATVAIGTVTDTDTQRPSVPLGSSREIHAAPNGRPAPRIRMESSREDSPAASWTASWLAEISLSWPDSISNSRVSMSVPNQITGNSRTLTHHQVANQRNDRMNGRQDTASSMMPVMP